MTADLVERGIVAPLTRIRTSAKDRILSAWMTFLAGLTLGTVSTVGGATIPVQPRIPARGGTLLIMNHQSLLDIPVAVKSLEGSQLKFVTRRRYAKGIPLISHMLHLYDCPLVDPGRSSAADLAELQEKARTSDAPWLIFPEGHRTRDGSLLPFRRSGLKTILAARPWSVYLVVADGFWRCGKIQEFVANVGSVRAQIDCLGPFEPPASEEELNDFIAEMRAKIAERLARMQAAAAASGEMAAEGRS